MSFLRDTLDAALHLYLDTAFFLLVGCLIGGIVYAFFPGRLIERWLGGKGAGTIVGAALIGAPLPLCSCGVVPTAITLKRRGASTGATVSFLVSTPETGPDSLLVSFALLDPLFAIFRPIAAIFTAVVAGLLAALGERAQPPPKPGLNQGERLCEICALPDEGENLEGGHRHGAGERMKRALHYAFGDLLKDVGPWLLIGLLLAGLLATVVRPDWVHAHISSPLLQMLVAMAVGIPLYVCASATTPLAAAAVAAGFSPGAALVFMLTGATTNVAALVVLRRELGTRVVSLMLLGIALASLACGLLLDWMYQVSGMQNVIRVGAASELLPAWLRVAAAVLLPLLVLAAFLRHRHPEPADHAH